MPTITTVPQRDSGIPVLATPGDGYMPLPKNHYEFCFEEAQNKKKCCRLRNSFQPETKSSFTTFVHFLHDCVIGLLQPLCFKTADSIDGDQFIISAYHKTDKCWERENCECQEEFEDEQLLCKANIWKQPDVCNEKVIYKLVTPKKVIPEKAFNNDSSVTQLIKESQIRGQLLASNGKDQLSKSKECVTKSRVQLEKMKIDVFAIRDDIRTARRLFQQVECGLQDCKWEELQKKNARNTYTNPVTALIVPSPYEKMYREHRVFLEEMKYHFRWQHGIVL